VALDVYKDWLGIPEGPRPPGHYELLRLVQFEDDLEKIRRNYAKLNAHVRKYAAGQYSVPSQELLNELAKAMLLLTDPDRKLEYDESLGREIDRTNEFGAQPLGQVLVDQGRITKEQLQEAQSVAETRGLSMRDTVVQLKLVDAQTAAAALADELRLSFVDLSDMVPDDSVLDMFPRNFVKRNAILPLFVDDDMLLVACVHGPDPELEEEIRLRSGFSMRAVIAVPLAVNQAITQYYAPGMRDEAAAPEATADNTKSAAKKTKKRAEKASSKEKSQPGKRMSQLSAEERKQRRQYGILIMCWAMFGSYLIDEFVIRRQFLPHWSSLYGTVLIVAPLSIWYVLRVYWK